MDNDNISKRIKSLLRNQHMTQADLADVTGIKPSAISEMLNGKRNIYPLAEKAASYFDASLEWIIGEGTDEPAKNGVPYYDVDFIGGFDMIINDQSRVPSYMVSFRPYDKATCWCNITGHSMEPEINHGDMIALRKIEEWWRFLSFGEIYAIVTKNDMRTVKRVGPGHTDDTYTLIPTNKSPEYAAQEISKDEILYVYEVMGSVKRF